MPFRNADATVPEKDRDSIERHTCEKQLDRERIAGAVRMAGGNLCEFKEALQAALPTPLDLWAREHGYHKLRINILGT
jgi:hypothetical protein